MTKVPSVVDDESPYKIGDRLFELCQSSDSVSSLLAGEPSTAPGDAWKRLYGHHEKHPERDTRYIGKGAIGIEELRRTRFCGKWGPNDPSELFLRMHHDALCTLNEDLSVGMVSPSLMGSSGVMPLTVISTIPDIVRHMSNLIVRAEKEVFLATNFWQNGVASRYITRAMRELSRRAGERGTRVVMKVMYDRSSTKQLFEPHQIVSEKGYTGKGVGLPAPYEIPNIDLQVMNYHQPVLGTFHMKYMVVDRKIGILQSNNIMDNDNLEMMVHLEGPIVDSLYDMALLSWHKRLNPPLPYHASPAASRDIGCFNERHAGIFSSEGAIKGHSAIVDPDKMPKRGANSLEASEYAQPSTEKPGSDSDNVGRPRRDSKFAEGHDEFPSAYLGEVHQTLPQSRIENPPASDNPLPEHTADDPHYDEDIAGEVERVQVAVSGKPGESHIQAVTRHLNHTVNEGFKGDAPECDPQDEMTPYIPHPAHDPFPIAMVCRSPYGPPNHKSVSNPQNAAWLSALRNAEKNVFIQSPTLNAEPLIPAIIEACERGVDVYCYISLGYNDAGELLPLQGGHNEQVAHQLHAAVTAAGREHLHYHWYVAKDQTSPLAQGQKRRSSHIKLLIADERVAVVGNGNQDTQSWHHSAEANVLLDSPRACAAWAAALRRNQNTRRYGALDRRDGVWRDAQGAQASGAMGVDPGRFSWARGVVGAVKRVQGVGGFT